MIVFVVFFYLVAISEAKLIFVTVVHRHGDRTPEYVYPTDPYQESFWKPGLGMLTNVGKNEMYNLGRFMRSRYSDFLPLTYHGADLHVEASESSRALMSAYLSLAGLYEPHGEDIWSPRVENWQPIPVYTPLPKRLDNKIYPVRPCPQYYAIREKVFQTEITDDRKEKYREVLKNLSRHTGLDLNLNFKDLKTAGYIFDTLFVEKSNNLKLPNWTVDFYPHPIAEIGMFTYFQFPYYNNEMKRFRCGPLLKEIIKHFDDKINGSIKQKWWQYSGHDLTIANLLSCLNVYDGERPVYASAVFLELHQNTENNYEVVVVYKKHKNLVQNLTIPNCTLHCPLEKLKGLVKDVIPNDWEEECKLNLVTPKSSIGPTSSSEWRYFVYLQMFWLIYVI